MGTDEWGQTVVASFPFWLHTNNYRSVTGQHLDPCCRWVGWRLCTHGEMVHLFESRQLLLTPVKYKKKQKMLPLGLLLLLYHNTLTKWHQCMVFGQLRGLSRTRMHTINMTGGVRCCDTMNVCLSVANVIHASSSGGRSRRAGEALLCWPITWWCSLCGRSVHRPVNWTQSGGIEKLYFNYNKMTLHFQAVVLLKVIVCSLIPLQVALCCLFIWESSRHN